MKMSFFYAFFVCFLPSFSFLPYTHCHKTVRHSSILISKTKQKQLEISKKLKTRAVSRDFPHWISGPICVLSSQKTPSYGPDDSLPGIVVQSGGSSLSILFTLLSKATYREFRYMYLRSRVGASGTRMPTTGIPRTVRIQPSSCLNPVATTLSCPDTYTIQSSRA